jgi:hypothetical protein
MTKSDAAEPLARRLVAEVERQARFQPTRWVMLGDIVPQLGVSWEEAEAAAAYAAARPREWIEHDTYSLVLRQAGRQMLEGLSARPGNEAAAARLPGTAVPAPSKVK